MSIGTSLKIKLPDVGLDVLYHLEQGSVYSDYAVIPFTMGAVEVVSSLKGVVEQ